MDIWFIGFIVVINVIIGVVLALIYRKKEKVDTGFAFIYYKLSYRRKIIRSFWSILIFIPALIIIYLTPVWNFQFRLIIIALLFFLFILQLAYNYFMWKKHEQIE